MVRFLQFALGEGNCDSGDHIGSKFTELAQIIKSVDNPRVAVCMDTQHMWAAGFNIADAEELESTLEQFDAEIGLDLLRAVHANDSKRELGSAVDRHDNIGEGLIGIDGFRNIMGNKAFADVPFYLEVPGFEKSGPDAPNVETMKKLRFHIEGTFATPPSNSTLRVSDPFTTRDGDLRVIITHDITPALPAHEALIRTAPQPNSILVQGMSYTAAPVLNSPQKIKVTLDVRSRPIISPSILEVNFLVEWNSNIASSAQVITIRDVNDGLNPEPLEWYVAEQDEAWESRWQTSCRWGRWGWAGWFGVGHIGIAQWLLFNATIRQRVLEHLHAFVGHLCVVERQVQQRLQDAEML